MFTFDWPMKEMDLGYSLAYSNSKSEYTYANAHIHISWSTSKRFVPTFWNPWVFLKVVPWVRMSHWPHNGPQWQPVLRRALIAGECHSGRVLDALYSLHAEVLTPCVGPLTPHLLSPLMWLYWLWHTEHRDDDQTIKSAPIGRAIRVTNHTHDLVSLSVCVHVHGLCARSKVWQAIVDKWGGWNSPQHTIPHESMKMKVFLANLIYIRVTRDSHSRRKHCLSGWLNDQDQADRMIAWCYR